MADKSESALRSYFQQGDIWEQEIIKRAKRSARVAWFFSIVFAGIALLSLLAVVLMLPLSIYSGWSLERQFGLGTQSLGGWFADHAKEHAATFVALAVAPVLALAVHALFELGERALRPPRGR